MSDKTSIEWADDSWNPIRARNIETGVIGHYCVKISPGCKNCYAEALNLGWPIYSHNRYAAHYRDKVEIFLDEKVLERPLRRKRGRDIFPCSMTDIFLEYYPDEWIERMFDVMYRARQHRFLVLTKRAERMRDFIVGRHGAGNNAFAFENVWFGISAEDRDEWDARASFIDEMTRLGYNTWASFEPLLGEINLCAWRVLWAVIGGESGPGARPFDIAWARSLRDQCRAAGVPYFLKQIGSNSRGWCAWHTPEHLCKEEAAAKHAKGSDGDCDNYEASEQAQPCSVYGRRCVMLEDRKGGDPQEWPSDLRIREYPA